MKTISIQHTQTTVYRKQYTDEEKQNAVKLFKSGISVTEISRRYNVSNTAVYKWINKYSQNRPNSDLHKIKQLEKENKLLKQFIATFIQKDFAS